MSPHKIFVGNLPLDVKKKDLEDLFYKVKFIIYFFTLFFTFTFIIDFYYASWKLSIFYFLYFSFFLKKKIIIIIIILFKNSTIGFTNLNIL